MLEKLEEQVKLAKEYGFDYIWVSMPIKDAEKYISTFCEIKRTSGLPNGSERHSNEEI